MPVTVVVGGQFGSEGKGKVAHFLAREQKATVAIRVGGSNSGHTVIDQAGIARVFRVLPTAAILRDTICVLAAGSYIDVDVLQNEINNTGITPDRLVIDPNAFVITEEHKRLEQEWHLGEKIGSTLSGTGAAIVDRIRRLSDTRLARNDPKLAPFVKPVLPFLRDSLERGERILIEGTQGFGLSLLHSPYYPMTTSRDTTASAFVAEAGLSPLDVDDVVLVIRAFPIRVGGNSGALPNEVDWETVTRESGAQGPLIEHTSVTKRIRRVARFDPTVVRNAIAINNPTTIFLNHLDYVDRRVVVACTATQRVQAFVTQIEEEILRSVDFLGISPTGILKSANYMTAYQKRA